MLLNFADRLVSADQLKTVKGGYDGTASNDTTSNGTRSSGGTSTSNNPDGNPGSSQDCYGVWWNFPGPPAYITRTCSGGY